MVVDEGSRYVLVDALQDVQAACIVDLVVVGQRLKAVESLRRTIINVLQCHLEER